MLKFFSRVKRRTVTTAAEERADIELQINLDLVERRKSVRPIPAPEAIECDDEESWSTWNELMDPKVKGSEAEFAVAELHPGVLA
jgi:hypothetical protein